MKSYKNLNYTLSGNITSLNGEPLKGLTVRAYDKDPVSLGNLLGSAVTDEAGLYTIQFTTKDFQIAGSEPTGPDVYISVFSGEDLLGMSKVKNNSPKKITIDLKVDLSNIKQDSGSGNPLPPVDSTEELDTAKLKQLDIFLQVVDADVKEDLEAAYRAAKGDWNKAIDTLFNWAKPISAFIPSNDIANRIRLTMKAKYKETDWEQVVKPLQDKLRENQRNALVSYLLPKVFDDNLVKVLVDFPSISNLCDLALTYSTKSLVAILEKNPDNDDSKDNPNADADNIMRIVFSMETSAVLQRMAEQEITDQQIQIDNANEVKEFLKNKYTNAELYFWMENSIKSLHQQVYTLSYDLAKKAERVFRFERGLSTSNFTPLLVFEIQSTCFIVLLTNSIIMKFYPIRVVGLADKV